MRELKTERSTQKMKVTTSATRLKRAIERKGKEQLLAELEKELELAFLDFIDLDVQYKAALEENDELAADFAVVNGMEKEAYTAAAEEIYDNARRAYDDMILGRVEKSLVDYSSKMGKLITKVGE